MHDMTCMRAAVFKKIHIAPSSHAKKKKIVKKCQKGASLDPKIFRTRRRVTIDKRTDQIT
jgi:hypothetical protein